MTNEVRKPPREFWIRPSGSGMGPRFCVSSKPYGEGRQNVIHVREILPGDDSLRVSREDWEDLKNVVVPWESYCSCHNIACELIERIERESKGE